MTYLARKGTVLDCPIATGRQALEAGEGTRRLWTTGLCSPAGPEARGWTTSETKPASDPFPIPFLVVSDLLPPYSPVYGLWLGVSGPEGRMGLASPEQPGVTRDLSSSAIFWREGKEFGVSFLLALLPSVGPSP